MVFEHVAFAGVVGSSMVFGFSDGNEFFRRFEDVVEAREATKMVGEVYLYILSHVGSRQWYSLMGLRGGSVAVTRLTRSAHMR